MADMSNVDISSQINSELSRIQINTEKSDIKCNVQGTWGLPLSGVYKLALKFYKGNQL